MKDIENKIIKKAIEYTEPYRPLEKGEDGEWYGSWAWFDVLDDEDADKLRELCLAVQEYLKCLGKS